MEEWKEEGTFEQERGKGESDTGSEGREGEVGKRKKLRKT